MLSAWGCGNVVHSHNTVSKIKWIAGVCLISPRLLLTFCPSDPQFLRLGNHPRLLLVTQPRPDIKKTTVRTVVRISLILGWVDATYCGNLQLCSAENEAHQSWSSTAVKPALRIFTINESVEISWIMRYSSPDTPRPQLGLALENPRSQIVGCQLLRPNKKRKQKTKFKSTTALLCFGAVSPSMLDTGHSYIQYLLLPKFFIIV